MASDMSGADAAIHRLEAKLAGLIELPQQILALHDLHTQQLSALQDYPAQLGKVLSAVRQIQEIVEKGENKESPRGTDLSDGKRSPSFSARSETRKGSDARRPSILSVRRQDRSFTGPEGGQPMKPPSRRMSLASEASNSSTNTNNVTDRLNAWVKKRLSQNVSANHSDGTSTPPRSPSLVQVLQEPADRQDNRHPTTTSATSSYSSTSSQPSAAGSIVVKPVYARRAGSKEPVLSRGKRRSESNATNSSEPMSVSDGVPSAYPSSSVFSGDEAFPTLKANMRESRAVNWVGDEEFRKLDRYMMAPNSFRRMAWDGLMLLNTAAAGVIISLFLVYFDLHEPPRDLEILLLYFLDLLWPIDVAFNFRTGFFRKGQVETRALAIAVHYSSRWLLLDLLSAWPLALTSKGSAAYVFFCCTKFLRVLQFPSRFLRLRSALPRSRIVGLPSFIFVVSFLSLHMMACGWRLAISTGDDAIENTSHRDNILSSYVADAYWATLTLTSVGYGDIVPQGIAARLYAIVVMLFGSAVFGAAVSAGSFVVHQALDNEVEKMTSQLKAFMQRRAVPANLQWRVQENLRRHKIVAESSAMAPQILESLSPILRRELCMSLLQKTLTQFPLFRAAQRAFVVELAQAHAWEHVMHDELVAEEGHTVADVVFVIEGCLQAFVPAFAGEGRLDMRVSRTASKAVGNVQSSLYGTEDSPPIDSLHTIDVKMAAGAWFGEAALFDQERVFSTAVTGMMQSDLAVLSCYDYLDVLKRYPWHQQQHESIRKELLAGNVSLEGLTYKEDPIFDPEDSDPNATLVAKFFNLGSKGGNASAPGKFNRQVSPTSSDTSPKTPIVPSGDAFDVAWSEGDDKSPRLAETSQDNSPSHAMTRATLSHVPEHTSE